jgi:dihydroorotate dehydrogenase
MVNCIPATVAGAGGELLFEGERRGIAGDAIRDAVLDQVRVFGNIIREHAPSLKLVGVGGIGSTHHVRDSLASGCHAVQLATTAMLDPGAALRIRRELTDGATPRTTTTAGSTDVPRCPPG